jgi:hypothetical protein
VSAAPKLALQSFGNAPVRCGTPREIVSHFRKFLQRFSGSGVDDCGGISNASAVRKGERCMNDTVHHFSTYPFTLSLDQVKEKKGICAREATAFGRGTKAMWAGATPPLVHAACPIVAWSRSSPHVCEQGTILESNMKCMSQPRVHIRNPETVRV